MAYYQQNYQEAVRYAQDGIAHAGDGVQAIRLTVNCAARALAHLPGRRSDAHAAVAHAYRLADRLDVPEGISGCISLGPYSYGRLIANAITVHQTLGEHQQVLNLTEQIEATLESSNSSWSRSLVRLDQANALLHGPPRDVEQAVSVAVNAIGASAGKPITLSFNAARPLPARPCPGSSTRPCVNCSRRFARSPRLPRIGPDLSSAKHLPLRGDLDKEPALPAAATGIADPP